MSKQQRIYLDQFQQEQLPTALSASEVIEEINNDLIILTLQSRNKDLTQQCIKLKEQKNQWNDERLAQKQTNLNYAKDIQEEKIKNQEAAKRCEELLKQLQYANQQIEKYKSINGGFDDLKRIMEKRIQKKQEFEKSRELIAQCEETRKRNAKILELQSVVANYEEKIDVLNVQINGLNLKITKITRHNQDQTIFVQRLERQKNNSETLADDTKLKTQAEYQQKIRNIEEADNRKDALARQRQAEFNKLIQNKSKQIQDLRQECSKLKKEYNDRIVSEREIFKQKSKLEDENQNLKNQIQFLTKSTIKYKSKVQNIENEDKNRYQQQIERIQATNQAKLKELSEQLRDKVSGLVQSSRNTQYILSKEIQQIKNNYEQQIKRLRKNILTLEEELNRLEADKDVIINDYKERLYDSKNLRDDIELRLTLKAEKIELLKEILHKNGMRSIQDKQMPILLENLLIQKSEILSDIREELDTIKKQKDEHCFQIAKTQQLVRALRSEFKLIKKFQDIICVKDSRLSFYGTTSQIQQFVRQIIHVEIQNQRLKKDQQAALKNISSKLSISQDREKELCLIEEQLQQQLLQQQQNIKTLNQRIMTLIEEKQSAVNVVNGLKLQIQEKFAKNQSQKQNIKQYQAYIKQIQTALQQKDKQIGDLRQVFNQKLKQQENSQQRYIQDLQRERNRVQQLEQKIEGNLKIINQFTNQNKLLEEKLTEQMEQLQRLNRQRQLMILKNKDQLEANSQRMNSDFELVLNKQHANHIQTCADHLKQICQALGEICCSLPQCNSLDDVVRYIKDNFLNAVDTTLSVSPILENKPSERSFLKRQVCKFLQVKQITTTFIYKYDKLNFSLINYLPQIKNNFAYILLMKTQKQIFGVICDGMEKKALPFNLGKRAVYPPQIIAKKSQNYFQNKMLLIGNKEIRLSCSRQKLQVAIFVTIYGDRYYNFTKSDLVGSDEQKQNIALQTIQIHRINL